MISSQKMTLTEKLRTVPIFKYWLAYDEAKTAVLWDTYSMTHLNKFAVFPDFPWTGSSLRPSAIRLLLNDIIINKRKSFLEFGAGISTLYFAEAARRYGGHLISVEQDASWMDLIKTHLAKAGLEKHVRFIHASIVVLSKEEGQSEWYDQEQLESSLGDCRFDLVLVDAPISSKGNRLVRLPAGRFIQSRLETDFSLFLDDIERAGEIQISRKWGKAHSWTVKNYWPRSSMAVFRNPSSRPFNIC
jgi:predicted O-methyltransferase YrrM